MGELLGWTYEQWAHACARMNKKPATQQEAIWVRKTWMSLRNYSPLEVQLEGVKPEMDYEAASKVFEMFEC